MGQSYSDADLPLTYDEIARLLGARLVATVDAMLRRAYLSSPQAAERALDCLVLSILASEIAARGTPEDASRRALRGAQMLQELVELTLDIQTERDASLIERASCAPTALAKGAKRFN